MNMKKFIKRNLAEIIVITVIVFAFSSCASTGGCSVNTSYFSSGKRGCVSP